MNKNKQLQKAGAGASQYQVDTIIIQNGIDEKRAREIYNEMFDIVRGDLTAEAYGVACRRINEFENVLIPKMQKIEGALNYFGDPAFQFVVQSAHRTAASTDRPADYALLSELLTHRIRRGGNRTIVAGIGRAVEIVDKISDEALLALSVAFAILEYTPILGSISEGLDVLDNLFGDLCYDKLPMGSLWMDHLDILDAIRISSFGSFKKLEDYYSERMPGYCAAGIKKGSENHEKAVQLLSDSKLPRDLLVINELNPEYYRLPIVKQSSLNTLHLIHKTTTASESVAAPTPLTPNQKSAVYRIHALYDKDTKVNEHIKKQFCCELLKRENLKKVRNWWNNISNPFDITGVGKVLAHANVKRCDDSLPDLM